MYYASHFETLKSTVNCFDSAYSQSVQTAQLLFQDEDLKLNLIYISSNFLVLPSTITKLEQRGLPLSTAVKVKGNMDN